jgi:hypothetical protein
MKELGDQCKVVFAYIFTDTIFMVNLVRVWVGGVAIPPPPPSQRPTLFPKTTLHWSPRSSVRISQRVVQASHSSKVTLSLTAFGRNMTLTGVGSA